MLSAAMKRFFLGSLVKAPAQLDASSLPSSGPQASPFSSITPISPNPLTEASVPNPYAGTSKPKENWGQPPLVEAQTHRITVAANSINLKPYKSAISNDYVDYN